MSTSAAARCVAGEVRGRLPGSVVRRCGTVQPFFRAWALARSTASPLDKLRQVTAASLRACRNGPDSTGARREIVLDDPNTMPLAAAPGYGEVHELGNSRTPARGSREGSSPAPNGWRMPA
jgi:hypothetical protein